MMIFKIINI